MQQNNLILKTDFKLNSLLKVENISKFINKSICFKNQFASFFRELVICVDSLYF